MDSFTRFRYITERPDWFVDLNGRLQGRPTCIVKPAARLWAAWVSSGRKEFHSCQGRGHWFPLWASSPNWNCLKEARFLLSLPQGYLESEREGGFYCWLPMCGGVIFHAGMWLIVFFKNARLDAEPLNFGESLNVKSSWEIFRSCWWNKRSSKYCSVNKSHHPQADLFAKGIVRRSYSGMASVHFFPGFE